MSLVQYKSPQDNDDARIIISISPSYAIDYTCPRTFNMNVRDVSVFQAFPVKLKVEGSQGDTFQLSRTGMLDKNQVCTGQISNTKGSYLTFDLTQ